MALLVLNNGVMVNTFWEKVEHLKAKDTFKKLKLANSILLSPFMNSNVICNTAHDS